MTNNSGLPSLLGLIRRIRGIVDPPRPGWIPTEFFGDPRLPKPKPKTEEKKPTDKGLRNNA